MRWGEDSFSLRKLRMLVVKGACGMDALVRKTLQILARDEVVRAMRFEVATKWIDDRCVKTIFRARVDSFVFDDALCFGGGAFYLAGRCA